MLRSKIKGSLIGGAIGDAWGMPVETWTPERIEATHPGGVHRYIDPVDHKWFKPETYPAGTTTDDTQFHVATMLGLMAGKEKAIQVGLDGYMDAIAQAHVDSLTIRDGGCGPSTREAIHRIGEGVSWRDSGKSEQPHRGTGNGIPMKSGALGAWRATPWGKTVHVNDFTRMCVNYAAMTHHTKISAVAGLIHAQCVHYCFRTNPERFSVTRFLEIANLIAVQSEEDPYFSKHYLGHLEHTTDKLSTVVGILDSTDLKQANRDQIRELFNNGGCYVYDSLPFTYAFFLRDPYSVQSLDDLINAGGDTDTNGKMLGEMLGALHGIELFQQPENQWMLDGLQDCSALMELADRFCDVFGVE